MNKSRKQRSEFATVLSRLLDNTQIFTRNEWSEELSVTSPAISQWVNDKTLPRPEVLRKIVGLVKARGTPQVALILREFQTMAQKPSSEVSKLFNRSHSKGDSISEYMLKPLVEDFLSELKELPIEHQEVVILKATALCSQVKS